MVGIVSSRDYRVSRMDKSEKVKNFMTPVEKLVKANYGITLSEANDIIWDNKINSLPVLYEDGRLYGFVFRKDYDSHQETRMKCSISRNASSSVPASIPETTRTAYRSS